MTTVRTTILGGAVVAIGGLVLALATAVRAPAEVDQVQVEVPHSQTVALATSSNALALTPSAPSTLPSTRTAGIGSVVTVDDIVAASADTSADAMAVLLAGLESADAVVVAESTNVLVARGAVWALPVLIDQDITKRPAAAPSIIDAMGRLGAVASPEQRSEVVDRLVALLKVEKTRASVEALGNTIQIYEALAQTGDPRAIEPLELELADRTVTTAPKVVIVQGLVALRATRSTAVLQRLVAELAVSKAEGFEGELQRELLGVLRDALVRLS